MSICVGGVVAGETVNQVINENSQLIFTELKPSLEMKLANIFLKYAGQVFSKVPFDSIFLP